MEYINNSLGIPVKGHFHDHISSRFTNFSGYQRKKAVTIAALTYIFPPAGLAYAALAPSEKKRYQEAMGYKSNPPTNLIKQYYSAIKNEFPSSSDMTSEQLLSIVEKLTSRYGNWDKDRDKKASTIAKSGKRLDNKDNKQMIAELAAVRAWMQAINDYRAEVVKSYEKAFAREEKVASTPPPSNQPPPAGNAPVFGSTDRLGTGESVGIGTGVSETAEKLKNVASAEVNVAGKKFPVKTIAMVAVGAGLVYYFFIRK